MDPALEMVVGQKKKVNTGEKKLPTQEIVLLVTFYVTKFEKLKKEGS